MAVETVPIAHRHAQRREPWPLAIGGVLLGMAGVLAVFFGVAVSHPDPVLVADAYAASGRYDAALRAAGRATALGLRLDLTLAPAPGGTRVALRLLDREGEALTADRAWVHRERPTQGGLDATVEAIADGAGWSAFVPLPLAGRWLLEARVERGGETIVSQIGVESGR